MPVVDGVGRRPHTEQKLAHFGGLLDMHLQIAFGASRKRYMAGASYVYVDMNAGPGEYWQGTVRYEGTPLIALPRLQQYAVYGLPYHACLIDNNPAVCTDLRGHLPAWARQGGVPGASVRVVCGDNAVEAVRCLNEHLTPGRALGLVVYDPNGDAELERVAAVAGHPRCAQVDVALYLSATTVKRVRGVYGEGAGAPLDERIRTIPKQYWRVREPAGQWQWTWFIGTNWKDFPEWKAKGFYRLESERGQEIIERLTYTSEERQRLHQLALPGVA